ncbi:energy transducer TonB [Sphingomonas sp.]|uniref:energy transducer TonB n=1 Tax=Sphingomonas sp. TaxID=28214 RepID=UPI002B71B2D9|nr:energy transducer TonB [Sphingomonas sp.]HTG39579.1 energy transducer TonB [Sphingomonas sp.]
MLILALALQAASADELTIIARIDVDVAGRITNCAIVESEAPPNVNEATCRALAQKGRVKPRVEDGKPVAAAREVRIRWRPDVPNPD